MSLEMLLSTPHTHGLITLCPMADPERNGFLAINQEFMANCDIPAELTQKKDQLYIGFKVTGMEDYEMPIEELHEQMGKMVTYHAANMMAVGIHQLLVTRKIAAVVWNKRPHDERNELGFDLPWPEYAALVPQVLYPIARSQGLKIPDETAEECWIVIGNFQYPVAASHVSYEIFGRLLKIEETL